MATTIAPPMSGTKPTRPGALKHGRSPQGSPEEAKFPRTGEEVGMDDGVESGMSGGAGGSEVQGLTGDLPDMPSNIRIS